jgi:hypothetical protein
VAWPSTGDTIAGVKLVHAGGDHRRSFGICHLFLPGLIFATAMAEYRPHNDQPGLRDQHVCRRGRIKASNHRRIDGVAMTVAAEATPDRAQRTGYNLLARHVPSAWPGTLPARRQSGQRRTGKTVTATGKNYLFTGLQVATGPRRRIRP